MRIVLVGAVESSRVALEVLAKHPDVTVAAVVTLPPGKAMRHADWVDLRAPAAAGSIPVIEADDVNADDVLAAIAQAEPDFLVVIGWSQICRRKLLELPREGAIGYHPAPLPENRGRAVIPWTILQGRRETGATLFWMDEGMDSGEILAQQRFRVTTDETAQSLYDKHMEVLAAMLDGVVWTLVRVWGDPYPGAFSFHRGRRLVVCNCRARGPGPLLVMPGQVQALVGQGALVQCGDGAHVMLGSIELDGGGRRSAAEVLKAHDRLGIDLAGLTASRGGAT